MCVCLFLAPVPPLTTRLFPPVVLPHTSMCVCMHMCMCVPLLTIRLFPPVVLPRTRMCVYAYVCVSACVYVRVRVHVCVCVCVCACVYACVHVYVYVHVSPHSNPSLTLVCDPILVPPFTQVSPSSLPPPHCSGACVPYAL